MAHYAKAKGGVPFHKREEERRWKEHLQKHKKMMKQTKPTIANANDQGSHLHMRLKLKRLQLQEDRMATIEYENRRLLANITRNQSKSNKDYWNENYIQKSEVKSPKREPIIESCLCSTLCPLCAKRVWRDAYKRCMVYMRIDKESSSSSSESENEDEELDEDEKIARQEEKHEKDMMKERRHQEKKENLQARREEALEHYRRVGILNQLGADVTVEENKKLKHSLETMMKKIKVKNEDDVETKERLEAIKRAQEALKKENEILDKSKKKSRHQEDSPREDQQRIQENVRLNKKLKEIQKGKGRKKVTDPEYDGLSRWWVTSPRGREKSEYEKERQKLLEEQQLAREKRKIEREAEERKIMKKKKEEKKKEVEKAPDGYRKKKKKKPKDSKSNDNNDDDELPDTSIATKNPYDGRDNGDNDSD